MKRSVWCGGKKQEAAKGKAMSVRVNTSTEENVLSRRLFLLEPISPTIFKWKLKLNALSVSFVPLRMNETERALKSNFHLNIVGEIGPKSYHWFSGDKATSRNVHIFSSFFLHVNVDYRTKFLLVIFWFLCLHMAQRNHHVSSFSRLPMTTTQEMSTVETLHGQ